MSAGDWGELLGILVNVRDEAKETAAIVADDDDSILPSLRYVEREAQRGVDLARRHALTEAGAT